MRKEIFVLEMFEMFEIFLMDQQYDSPYYVHAETVAGPHILSDSFALWTIGHPEQGIVTGLLLRAIATAGGKQHAIGLVEKGLAEA